MEIFSSNILKNPYISRNRNPKKASYISGNGTFQYTPRGISYISGSGSPKIFLIFFQKKLLLNFGKRKPPKKSLNLEKRKP